MVQIATWLEKDPDETVFRQLDWIGALNGATIIASEWNDVTGIVLGPADILPGGQFTRITISGGADGTTGGVTNRVVTTAGETLEQIVAIDIVSGALPELAPYQVPTAAHLKAKYPAFASASVSTVQTFISEAAGDGVDTSWSEASYAPAILALAAHRMALLDIGDHGEASGFARAGLTRVRSGSFDAAFSESKVASASGGGLDATIYGQRYRQLLRVQKGGPRLVGGHAGTGDWGHIYQRNDGGYTPWGF